MTDPEREDDPYTFKELPLKRPPKAYKQDNTEEKFWRKFQFPIVVKEYAAVSSIHFAAAPPYDFVVTSGSRVQVYSSATNQVKKTVSRFKEAAYSGCFRHDGNLLAAGSEEGIVKVFDVNSRAILRQCKGHSKPVKAVRFSLDGLKLVSGSDDTTVRYWDMSTETCVSIFKGHEDYIRSVVASPASTDLVFSGSYDHALMLWDLRSPSPVLRLDHGAPVEMVLVFPSGGTCVSAGGNFIKVWDVLSGGRLLAAFSNHQKTITALGFDGSGQRLFSGGLDKQLKVYSVEDYRVVHSMSYPSPILSLAMSPRDSHLVVGMTSRLLSIKHTPHKVQSQALALSARVQLRGGTYRYFIRGKSYQPNAEEYVVRFQKKRRLQLHDRFLQKFQYKRALDACLQPNVRQMGAKVYTVLQELARRDGLSIALSGRNEEELLPLVTVLTRTVIVPKYTPLLLDVCNLIIDIYGGMLSASETTRRRLTALKHRIDQEVLFQKEAFKLLGSLDTILTAATATQRHSALAMGGGRTGIHVLPPGQGAAVDKASYEEGLPSVLGVGELSDQHRTVTPNQTH